jgi:hypothetical protein
MPKVENLSHEIDLPYSVGFVRLFLLNLGKAERLRELDVRAREMPRWGERVTGNSHK